MPVIKFIELDGTTRVIDVTSGTTIMQAARDNEIAGIEAECGGACACATCHCYIEDGWLDRLEPRSDVEAGMLDCVVEPAPNSRLGCQVTLTDALSGITVRIPKSQY